VRDRAASLAVRIGGAASHSAPGVPIGIVLIVEPKQRGHIQAQVNDLLRNSGLPVQVIGAVADDPDGAAWICGRGRGRLDRSLLIRSAREVAANLEQRLGASGPPAGGIRR
jgi:hypothetical protein